MNRAAGRYHIAQRVGAGGTGEVFRATDTLLGRTVALKALDRSIDADVIRREARALARLDHPNIVAVHDLIEDNGTTYLVMEYVEGISVADRLNQEGSLDLDRALQIIRDVGRAVQYAHSSGVLHCDIKPANVLIATSGAIKLADFTLARSTTGDTQIATDGATAAYAAPEQLRGGSIDERTDVFALGRLLQSMLPPANGRSSRDRAVRQAIMRATAEAPERRFTDVGDLLDALPTPRPDATTLAAHPRTGPSTRVAPLTPGASPAHGTGSARLRRITWVAGALAGVAVATLSGVGLANRFSLAASPARITVPNLVRTGQANAEQVAASLQLRRHEIRQYSAQVPSGEVIAQRPAAGAQVPRQSTLTLVISRGPKPVTVPDLSGLSKSQAVNALAALGLHAQITTSTTVFQSSDQVLAQSPMGGAVRTPGSTITVTVSQAPCWLGVIAC